MAYPEKPDEIYNLREYDFASNDTKKVPMSEYLFKNGYKNADESDVESIPDGHEQNWLFDVLHRNLRYTLETAEENKKLLENKIATPTNIGQVQIGYGLEITQGGVLSVSKGVAEDANIISYDLPVGSYMLWAGNNTPEYFIEPQGQTLLRDSYPELWEFAVTNQLVGSLFGEGDGSTTFTVTDIRGSFISIAKDNDLKVGVHRDAGLPPITHTHTRGTMEIYGKFANGQPSWAESVHASGAFAYAGYDAQRTANDGSRNTRMLDFYASRHWTGATSDNSGVNAIYGKSGTVMPDNWSLKLILKAKPTPPSNAVPTGTILDYTYSTAPDGYVIANGAQLSRTKFAKLYQWAVANKLMKNQSDIPSTPHAYYGTGDGSTTFTIPDLRGVFKRNAGLGSAVTGSASLGVYQNDGLPNIYGSFYKAGGKEYSLDWANDAFYKSSLDYGVWGQSGGGGKGGSFNFSARRCSTIYGDSSYVQPKSVSIVPILKY